MKNIHIIPTDKPSRFWFYKQTVILFTGLTVEKSRYIDTQHIYITSDEEIKVGDWVIEFQKGDNIGEVHFINGEYVIANEIQKKIIITTDQDLERVQAIDDEFLEWFVKNPSCEEVEIKEKQHFQADKSKRKNPLNGVYYSYKIIIPKEEPKQETHICKYCKAETTQSDDECYAKPKQETLEETAERLLGDNIDGLRDALKDDDLFYFYKGVIQSYGEAMAQWQAERMYSKKDMEDSFVACWKANVSEGIECKLSFKEWFEQFKKK